MKPQPDLVLVAGPMVGASSRAPTAERLHSAGSHVHVPEVRSGDGALPPLHALAMHYVKLPSLDGPAILVGHSLATLVIASTEGTVAMCRAARSAQPLEDVRHELELVLSAAIEGVR